MGGAPGGGHVPLRLAEQVERRETAASGLRRVPPHFGTPRLGSPEPASGGGRVSLEQRRNGPVCGPPRRRGAKKVGKVQPFKSFPNPAGPHGLSDRAPRRIFALARGRAPVLLLLPKDGRRSHAPPPPARGRPQGRSGRQICIHCKTTFRRNLDHFSWTIGCWDAHMRASLLIPRKGSPEPRRRTSGEAFLLRP